MRELGLRAQGSSVQSGVHCELKCCTRSDKHRKRRLLPASFRPVLVPWISVWCVSP